MTTATDWQPGTWTDTGELAVVTDVTSAATEAPARWVATTPDHIHDDLCRTVQPAEYAEEATPYAGDQPPDTTDVRCRIRLTHASGRLASRLDGQAQVWHEIASQAWAAQTGTPHLSERYTARREALEQAYERERDALIHGLRSTAPAVAGQVYDEQRGWIDAGPPHRTHWPDPPDAREGLDKLKQRVPTALTTGEGATQVGASKPTSNSHAEKLDVQPPRESRWVRVLRWLGGGAA